MQGFSVLLVFALSVFFVSGGYITFNYGGRANKLYVPNNYDSSKKYPLFVMLHGCTQDPDQFSTGTKMNTLGEQHGLLVLYPLQPSTANINKCWNWFEPLHQARGSGEPAFIAGATAAVAALYEVDTEAVFVAGLSAGGAMAVLMAATYPDVYSGVVIGAGLEYKAATTLLGGLTAMRSGGPPPRTQGSAAWNAMRPNFKKPMKFMVFHGTSDFTVYPINGDQSAEQWVWTNDFALGGSRIPIDPVHTIPGQVPGGRSYTEYQYGDTQTGTIWGRYFVVNSMGHAWSGGALGGTYTDPNGPDASLLMIQWFLGRSDTSSVVEN